MEAIILAGGFGTRLSTVVSDVPKPMAPINGRPFLEYLLDDLNEKGINRVILAVGYKKEIIKSHFKEKYKNIDIVYSDEDIPLGTGGAIKKALTLAKDKEIFIINGDTFFDVDLKEMYQFHKKNNSKLTLAIKEMEKFDRYGSLILEGDKIIKFKEKKYIDKGYINGGIYLIKKELLNKEEKESFSFEKDILENESLKIEKYGYKSEGYFIDIGIPKDYYKLKKIYEDKVQLTVIIPTYNRKFFLFETLKRLEKQACKEFNIIIVDNASNYSIEREVLTEFNEIFRKKIVIFHNKYNIGLRGNLARIMTMVENGWFWTLGDDECISEEAIEIIYQEIKSIKDNKVGHIIFSSSSSNKKYDERYLFDEKIFKNLSEYINYSYARKKKYTSALTYNDFMSIYLSINIFNSEYLKKYLGESYSYAYTGAAHIIPSLLALRDEEICIKVSSKKIVEILDFTDAKREKLSESEVWGENFYPIMLGLASILNIDFKGKLTKDEIGKLSEMIVWFPIRAFFIEAIKKGKEYKRMYELLYYTNFRYSLNKKRKIEAYLYKCLLKTVFNNDEFAKKFLYLLKNLIKRKKGNEKF